MGVEPTSSCFAGSRRAVWLQRQSVSKIQNVLARNRTWSSTFAESRAIHHTPRTLFVLEYPAEESNLVLQLRRLPCVRHTRKAIRSRIEERMTAHASLRHHVHVPTWTRTRTWTFGGSDAIRYTIGTIIARADDWIRTSINRFTRQAPFSFRATSASVRSSTSARSRTPSRRFWRPPALPGAHSCSGPRTVRP